MVDAQKKKILGLTPEQATVFGHIMVLVFTAAYHAHLFDYSNITAGRWYASMHACGLHVCKRE